MKSQYLYFTKNDLPDVPDLSKLEPSIPEESTSIDKKKDIISRNILEIERNLQKLRNINHFLKKTIDETKKEQDNTFVNEINEQIDKLNKIQSKEKEIPEEILNKDKIETNLFEFYKNEINRMKIQKIEHSDAFNNFFNHELEKRREFIKNQLESEQFYSIDETQSVHDLITNLMNM